MTSYMLGNFERFDNNISIVVMKSQVLNAKEFCYIVPVVLNGVGKIDVVCEAFVISDAHDVYCLILNSLFKICLGMDKSEVYAIFSDKSMTTPILG